MLTAATAAGFGGGLYLAALHEGWLRVLGTSLLFATEAMTLNSVAGGSAVWAIGPVIAGILLVSKPAPRLRFEPLMQRTAVTVSLGLAGGYFARRLPLGDTPWLLFAIAWVITALGLSWLAVPRDRAEARRGAALAIAGGGAVLLSVFPAGVLASALTGGFALVPALAERLGVTGAPRGRSIAASPVLGTLALGCAAMAAVAWRPRILAAGLTVSLDSTALVGAAVLLTVAAFAPDSTIIAAAVLGALSLALTAPAPHWAALAAALAMASWESGTARFLWAGLVLLGLAPALSDLISGPLGERWEAVALAAGWLVLVLASTRRWLAALVLAASTLYVVDALHHLARSSVPRFQWVVGAGIGLAILTAIARPDRDGSAPAPSRLGSVLSTGLIMIGLATGVAVGTVGAILLVLDLAVIQASAPSGPPAVGLGSRPGQLARSGWPPAAAFAGRVLVLMAAASTSAGLAALATLLIAGSQLAPLWDARPPARPHRPARISDWIATAISLAAGIAPVALLRMLQG